MKQIVTEAIILSRTDYGEADRILTLLTPEYGKLSLLAKGVRRVKSKLAGGIELFSVSTITYVQGRGSLGTLVSTRLIRHYHRIVTDLHRTMLGYELIKRLAKHTEDEPEAAYFHLLVQAFEALDDTTISVALIEFWFMAQLLRLAGHTPNLHADDHGAKLDAGQQYSFNLDHMAFMIDPSNGIYNANHIKFLRLAFAGHTPAQLQTVAGSDNLVKICQHIPASMLRHM